MSSRTYTIMSLRGTPKMEIYHIHIHTHSSLGFINPTHEVIMATGNSVTIPTAVHSIIICH
jgi:hypothetical protein